MRQLNIETLIKFEKHTLENGLRVILHKDKSTPLAVINLLYDVGARDELPEKTGFAHLFEHLMFGGTEKVPNFDVPIQNAGGDCNAFTNNDITNFYSVVPYENLETALWLEADRMTSLLINKTSLETQQKVVVEEFKETCLNRPYGDVWHQLGSLAFEVHPYQWPTIGRVPEHVESADLQDVTSFFDAYYQPNNAVLVVAGNIDFEDTLAKVKKWFGNIKAGNVPERNLPKEPLQKQLRRRVNESDVPLDSLYLAFHMPGRGEPDYHAVDLLTDILANGQSSRLYRKILKEEKLVSSIDCYVTGSYDPGLLIVEAKPADGVDLETIEAAIWKELNRLKRWNVPKVEFQKIKNKVESTLIFTEMNITHKAMNLAFYEALGDASLINQEAEKYRILENSDIRKIAKEILVMENCSTLYYKAKPRQN